MVIKKCKIDFCTCAFVSLLQSQCAAQGLPLTSFLVQLHHGVCNAAPDDAPLIPLLHNGNQVLEWPPLETTETSSNWDKGLANTTAQVMDGTSCLTDSLCQLKFQVSPTAFFQVNAGAACLLYKIAGEWAGHQQTSTVLDVCCGTGTIGLTVASACKRVIGVDIVERAIEDAKRNSQANGATNCEWVAGKAETVLTELLPSLVGGTWNATTASTNSTTTTRPEGGQAMGTTVLGPGDLVAIVDPPRAGLHKHVLSAILMCPQIKRLVYVSCNPDTLADNGADLCTPYAARSQKSTRLKRAAYYKHFQPVEALAVDLFPHTKHCEAIMCFER